MGRKQLWTDEPTERHDTRTREVYIELEKSDDLLVGLRVDIMIDSNPPTPTVPPESETVWHSDPPGWSAVRMASRVGAP